MPEDLWTEVRDIVQEAVINTIPKKKKCKKAKWLSDEDLQIAEKRREAKGKGEKERFAVWCRNSREEITRVQVKEEWLHFAGAAVKRYPMF